MAKIRLTYECQCGAFDVMHADLDDWQQGAVVVQCFKCHRTLHQLDGCFEAKPEEDN
jgi:predicted SprT family Zn-dependent metalloprotease